MKVTLAKSAGFCFGVTRAVNEVYKQIEEGITPIYTYGPIIHNDEVIREMEAKGVRVIRDLKIGNYRLTELLDLHIAGIVLTNRNRRIDDIGDHHHIL